MSESMSESILHFRVPSGKGEYVLLVEDMMRMATIQVTIQTLMAAQGGASLDVGFVVYLLQVMVGVAVYWLVVRRVVNISPDSPARQIGRNKIPALDKC